MIKGLREVDYFLMLAEECGELSSAVSKLIRKIYARNYTPKSEDECMAAVIEEMVDVRVALDQLLDFTGFDIFEIEKPEDLNPYDNWLNLSAMASNLATFSLLWAGFIEGYENEKYEMFLVAARGYTEVEKAVVQKKEISEEDLKYRYQTKLKRWKERQRKWRE